MPSANSQGLTASEAADRLAEFGPNELPSARPKSLVKIAFVVVQEPMLLLLFGAVAVYLVIGDRVEAGMLAISALVIAGITIIQERRSESALEGLRDLSSPRATIIRDGQAVRLAGREVVPGDLILLKEGDRVPADAQVVASMNLAVDESLLTGESVSIDKGADDEALSGTLVVRGEGSALVLRTGLRTVLGQIGASMAAIGEEATPLLMATRLLVRVFAGAAALTCVVVAVAYGASRQNWIGGILAGITTAISAIPEEFPLVLTMFLALGALRLARRNVLTRRVAAIECLGAATVLCVDKTGTLTQNRMTVARLVGRDESWSSESGRPMTAQLVELARTAALASSSAPFDPMEQAIQQLHSAHGGTTAGSQDLVRQYPLASDLLAMAHAWKTSESGTFDIAIKGAPEAVAGLCAMSAEEERRVQDDVRELAEAGFRVIAVASQEWAEDLPAHHREFSPRFLGLVALVDPPRPGVRESVKECYEAGIRVVMITGDHPATARAVAKTIGLIQPEAVLLGRDLETLAPQELKTRVAKTSVFARISPNQKLLIVQALKESGEVVGMTGDGVNDGPALRAADIGIAMGQRGTDVAREAADLVLLDDDFTSIVAAIRLGRRIYTNLKNAMRYILAVHVPIVGMSLVPVLLGWPLILLPAHVVLLEIVVDPACSTVFEAEPSDSDTMTRPPRSSQEPLFTWQAITICIAQGAGTLGICLSLFVLGSSIEGGSEGMARAIAYGVLLLSNLALIATNLSASQSTFRTLLLPNTPLRLVFAGVATALIVFLTSPTMLELLHFSPLTPTAAALLVGGGLAGLAWLEMVKAFRRRFWPDLAM